MSGGTGAGEPGTRVEVPAGQGVQVGDHDTQVNKFIETYIEKQVIQPPPAPAAGPVVAGEVPQRPPAFQPRAELLAALGASGPGVYGGAGGDRDARGGQDPARGGVCPVPYRCGLAAGGVGQRRRSRPRC